MTQTVSGPSQHTCIQKKTVTNSLTARPDPQHKPNVSAWHVHTQPLTIWKRPLLFCDNYVKCI